MEPLIPNKDTFLQKRPQRVSRIYPIIALLLSIVSSGLTYAFVDSRINRDTEIATRNTQITFLEKQVALLTAQQRQDQASLREATTRLTETTKKLDEASNSLAEKERTLAATQEQIKRQQAQLSNNATELENLRNRPPLFSFQSTVSNPAREAAVKKLITDAYDVITELYGKPYLLNQITISFVEKLTIPQSSGETTIESGPGGISITIRLIDFDENDFQDVNTVIHEVIHGFHGIAVLDSSAFEEGMTVAATDAVMDRLQASGKLSLNQRYIGINEATYNSWSNSIRIFADNERFYTSPDIGKIYQITGYAWREMLREDGDLFRKLNEAYYKDVQVGKTPTDALIRGHLIRLLPTVNGQPTADWIAAQPALNPQ